MCQEPQVFKTEWTKLNSSCLGMCNLYNLKSSLCFSVGFKQWSYTDLFDLLFPRATVCIEGDCVIWVPWEPLLYSGPLTAQFKESCILLLACLLHPSVPTLAPVEALLASLQGYEIQALNFERCFILKQTFLWTKIQLCAGWNSPQSPSLVIQQSDIILHFLKSPISW